MRTFVFLILNLAFLFTSQGQVNSNLASGEKNLLQALIENNDKAIPDALSRQFTNEQGVFYGAVFDRDSVVSPGGTAGLIQILMCSYVSRESKYYQSKEILQRMTLATSGLLRMQHEDGTVDLLSTNFHSTPDLGFTIYPLAFAYSLMLKNNRLHYGELPDLMKTFLLRAGKALSVGGIHTPNHRWVVSGALAWLYSFFHNPEYKTRIDQWLAEKIDIDPDGQYNERSTAIYTPVTNMSLLTIAKRMDYKHLYDIIRRNLDMTFYFVHANGEIATESSNRQDQYQRSNMGRYYLAYKSMALLDKDVRYSGMVKYIESTVKAEQLGYMLPYFLDDPSLTKDVSAITPLPTKYHKHFKYSDMVRIREDSVDMSIIMGNAIFFTFFKGEAALEGVRLSSAFFGKGQFQSQQMEKVDDTYILTSTLSGPYYQPLPKDKIPVTGDAWSQVSRDQREQSEVQELVIKVFITPQGGKAKIKVSVDGPENLPVALELAFRSGGSLTLVKPQKDIDKAYLASNGQHVVYQYGKNTISVGPGIVEHNWTQLRGALPKLSADCVYFTAYGPCEFEFLIE